MRCLSSTETRDLVHRSRPFVSPAATEGTLSTPTPKDRVFHFHVSRFYSQQDKAQAKKAILSEQNRISPPPTGVLTPPQSSKKQSSGQDTA